MQEVTRYGVGVDVGTTHVRCVVGHLDESQSAATIVGVGSAPNNGMRKGTVVNIVNTAHAIDKALEEAERMSGHQISGATISANGSHIMAITSKGVVAVNSQNHEITEEDIARANEAATVVQLPANREILQVTPRSYTLDDQTNIKDPLGMSGVRLEVDAHVITALSPNIKNLLKSLEMTQTHVNHIMVAGLAASKAVVVSQQMENGVAIIDFGGTTTQLVVFEEGDLQHAAVLPMGSVNITNDLAIGLRTDLEVAEIIKLDYAGKVLKAGKAAPKTIEFKHGKDTLEFDCKDIAMIIEARLDEIFEHIDKELKSIDRSGKLPGGVILTGGGAKLASIAEYAKQSLRLPARVANVSSINGMSDRVQGPEFATALGLMLSDLEGGKHTGSKAGNMGDAFTNSTQAFGKLFKSAGGFIKRFKP